MKPTVSQGLSQRPVAEGGELESLNREVVPVLTSIREAVNYESTFRTIVTSADSPGVAKRLWESDEVPSDGLWVLELRATGAALGGNLCSIIRTETWKIASSAATRQVAVTHHATSVGLTPPTLAFDSTADVMYASATDDGSGDVTWVTVVRVLEVLL